MTYLKTSDIIIKGDNMNKFIKEQTVNMIRVAEAYISMLAISATQDDGIIDKEEQKTINTITKTTRRYIKNLNKIKNRNAPEH